MTKNKKVISTFFDLLVWQKAHELSLLIYSLSKSFPKDELYGLTNQMRRASVSISSNIAEGFSMNSKKSKNNFYSISKGSLHEIQSQLALCRDLKYINSAEFIQAFNLTKTLNALLTGLVKSSKDKINT